MTFSRSGMDQERLGLDNTMNKRIQELAEQAYGINDSKPFHTSALVELEKFAKLIVDECCQAFWTDECHISDLAYLDYKEKTTKLKRHFGMEE